MPLQLQDAEALAPNEVRLTFSAAVAQNAALLERSHYSFTTRFGEDIPIYTASVVVEDSTHVRVRLIDAMLQGGYYTAQVSELTAADGSSLDPNGQTANFVGLGLPLHCFRLKRCLPTRWKTAYGTVLGTVLEATGFAIDALAGMGSDSQYTRAQQALSLRTAEGADLAALAANYGVERPEFANDDDLFRRLVPILATSRKSVLKIFHDVLTALVGPQKTAGWQVFEVVPNRIVIEIPAQLLSGYGAAEQADATYLHNDATSTSDTTFPGDYFLPDATHDDTEVGSNPVTYHTGVNNIIDVISQIKAAGVEFTIYAP